MKTLALLALLASFGMAHAATVEPLANRVVLTPTAVTAPGRSTDAISTQKGFQRLGVLLTGTSGTLNVDLEQSCDGVNWFDVTGHIDITAVPSLRIIDNPICIYSVNFDTCNTGCSVSATAYVVRIGN